MVFLLVMVDVIYLTVWQVMDPMRRIVREFSDEVRSIITICYCDFPCNRFIMDCYLGKLWRRGGLVVSALDFQSRGRWFEPGHCCHVVSLEKKLYSTLSLSTQVYKWVPAIIMLRSNLAMD